jgi:lipopolysaccharide/colanic/teichoic acid biosynthesis glycosyltransferase
MEHKCYGPYERYVKRPLDCFLALVALIVFSPIIGITALIVKIKIGSPVFFSQERPGLIDPKTGKERIFRLYKFRSMTNEKDTEGNLLPDEKRLTKVGKVIRAASIDELPELINIIKGDMAVVGPRPLLVKYLPWYSEEQHKRHFVRPGLTGYAQAHGRNAVSWDEKFQMDVDYTERITFFGDAKIILATVKTVIKHEGISSVTSATMESFIEYCKSLGREQKE